MPLLDQLQKDLVASMKAKDEARLSTVRMIKTAFQKANSVDPSKPLDEAGELGLHGPGDLGARVARAQRVEDGQRVHHVAEVREAHEQDARRAGRHGRGV